MTPATGGEVTRLLRGWRSGDAAAGNDLLRLVYSELHRIAARHMSRERPEHTLRPTDLIGEAYIRLAEGTQPDWEDRIQFFAIAAKTMRRILVDHARSRKAEKRGGRMTVLPFDDSTAGVAAPFDMLALDEALEALARNDPRKVRAFELSYFGGLSQDEVAEMLEVHVNTVARDLTFTKAWLRCRIYDAR